MLGKFLYFRYCQEQVGLKWALVFGKSLWKEKGPPRRWGGRGGGEGRTIDNGTSALNNNRKISWHNGRFLSPHRDWNQNHQNYGHSLAVVSRFHTALRHLASWWYLSQSIDGNPYNISYKELNSIMVPVIAICSSFPWSLIPLLSLVQPT